MRNRQFFGGYLIAILFLVGQANAQAPHLQFNLDIYYSDPSLPSSPGSWELIALADGRGLAGATVLLDSIDTVPVFKAPTGTSTSASYVGFQPTYGGGAISFAIDRGTHWQLAFNQIPTSNDIQGLFYDVGVPGGATQPGQAGTPIVPNLVGVNIPWNYDDLLGDFDVDGNPNNNNGALHNGVLLARGHFDANSEPDFYSQLISSGNVFTQVGTSTSAPPLDSIQAATVTKTIRDNRGIRPGDANIDGVVDALDFIAWNANKFQNQSGWRNGDFNGDLRVDGSDFLIWNLNRQTGSQLRTVGSVPEPGLSCLGAILGAAILRRRANRTSREVREQAVTC